METLRGIRKRQHLSQWALAKEASVHQSRISLIDNGFVEATQDEKMRLSTVLGVDPDAIKFIEPTK